MPKEYLKFGMPSEIKFSLETEEHEEALLLCQEHNLRLERAWRDNLIGTPPDQLSHLQIVALAGEFYAEMIATHRDDPGRASDWQQSLQKTDRRKRFRIGPLDPHLRMTFGDEPPVTAPPKSRSGPRAPAGKKPLMVILDEKLIENAKIKAIRDKTNVSRVSDELLRGWLSGLYKLKQ